MNPTGRSNYERRMLRALDFIENEAHRAPRLEEISAAAAFSPFHFHRQFRAWTGLTLDHYVRLVRLRRASDLLAYHQAIPITRIALDAGFESPDGFSRAFKRVCGQVPSEFRRSPDWASWHRTFDPLKSVRSIKMSSLHDPSEVTIRTEPERHVAIVSHSGDPQGIGDSIRRFIDWRRANGLPPSRSASFNIFHSSTDLDRPEVIQTDLCAEVRPGFDGDSIVETGTIAGGRVAVLTLRDNPEDLGPSATWLYRDWLPASGEETRPFPLYCRRYPEREPAQQIIELYLPLA